MPLWCLDSQLVMGAGLVENPGFDLFSGLMHMTRGIARSLVNGGGPNCQVPAASSGFAAARSAEGTTARIMMQVEVSARFPKLWKESFVQRGAQVADSLRTTGATLGAHHALNHAHVMRAPERKVFVMFEQRLGQFVFLVALFVVSQ